MNIPPLRSAKYPLASQWATPLLTELRLNRLCTHLAVFVAVDKKRGSFVTLGNGFIMIVGDHLQMMSASHLFSDFANRLWDRAPHAFTGITAAEDLREAQEREAVNRIKNVRRRLSGLYSPRPWRCNVCVAV